MLGIGWGEMLVIGAVALLVVGPDNLPEMFRAISKIYRALRDSAVEAKNAIRVEALLLEKELAAEKEGLAAPMEALKKDLAGERDQLAAPVAELKADLEGLDLNKPETGGEPESKTRNGTGGEPDGPAQEKRHGGA